MSKVGDLHLEITDTILQTFSVHPNKWIEKRDALYYVKDATYGIAVLQHLVEDGVITARTKHHRRQCGQTEMFRLTQKS